MARLRKIVFHSLDVQHVQNADLALAALGSMRSMPRGWLAGRLSEGRPIAPRHRSPPVPWGSASPRERFTRQDRYPWDREALGRSASMDRSGILRRNHFWAGSRTYPSVLSS